MENSTEPPIQPPSSQTVTNGAPGSGELQDPIVNSASRKKRWLFWAVGSLIAVVVIIVAILKIGSFIYSTYEVTGDTMAPTLKAGQQITTTKSYHKVVRGDIVVIKKSDGSILVKRIVGLPGERIVIKDGKVTIYNNSNADGFNPDSKYEKDTVFTDGNVDLTIPTGEVFILGDNRQTKNYTDSRNAGTLPIEKIIGKEISVI